jgi:hypothetical protein
VAELPEVPYLDPSDPHLGSLCPAWSR